MNSKPSTLSAFNTGISSGREAVEWNFGKIVQLFAFVDFRKNQSTYSQLGNITELQQL